MCGQAAVLCALDYDLPHPTLAQRYSSLLFKGSRSTVFGSQRLYFGGPIRRNSRSLSDGPLRPSEGSGSEGAGAAGTADIAMPPPCPPRHSALEPMVGLADTARGSHSPESTGRFRSRTSAVFCS